MVTYSIARAETNEEQELVVRKVHVQSEVEQEVDEHSKLEVLVTDVYDQNGARVVAERRIAVDNVDQQHAEAEQDVHGVDDVPQLAYGEVLDQFECE
jgi:hypothetical protein